VKTAGPGPESANSDAFNGVVATVPDRHDRLIETVAVLSSEKSFLTVNVAEPVVCAPTSGAGCDVAVVVGWVDFVVVDDDPEVVGAVVGSVGAVVSAVVEGSVVVASVLCVVLDESAPC